MKALGVTQTSAQRFFQNRGYTLTMQTRIIAALDGVKAKGSAAYIDAAAGARGERTALFFVESAEMLQRAHGLAPVTAILDDTEAMVARQGGHALMVLPLDSVTSTAQTREVLTEVNGRAKKELGADRVEVWLTGRASERMRKEMSAVGWALKEQQPIR